MYSDVYGIVPEENKPPVFSLESCMSNLDINDPSMKLFFELETDIQTELGKQFCGVFDRFFNFKNERNFYSSLAQGILPFEAL